MSIRGSPYNSYKLANLLQETTFIINSLANASTALCPHEIMFGTQLRLPLDKWLPVAYLNKHVEVQEHAVWVTQRNYELLEQVREKTEGAQAKWNSSIIVGPREVISIKEIGCC